MGCCGRTAGRLKPLLKGSGSRLGASLPAADWKEHHRGICHMHKIKIWAHRGASGYAPENTMEAYILAHQYGADGIELDVQLSRDGEIVVIHDEKVDRTSNGKGLVRDFTLKQLRSFNYNRTKPEHFRAGTGQASRLWKRCCSIFVTRRI